MSNLIKICFYFLLMNLYLFGGNYDPRSGTTMHDASALYSIIGDDYKQFEQPLKKIVTYDEELFELDKYLKKYLVSSLNGERGKLSRYSKLYYEYALLSNATYNPNNKNNKGKSVLETDWILDEYVPKIDGLVVCLFKKKNENKYVIAIGGTTANSSLNKYYDMAMDIWSDLTLLSETTLKPNQLLSLKNWYNNELSQKKKQYIIAITGHSLGGGLAQYLGLMTGIKTYTFNTAPLPLTKASSKDLDGGFYEKEIVNPYYTHWTYNIQHSRHIYNDEVKIMPPKKITVKGFENFTNANVITNIMTKNDPLTQVLKYVEYLETKDTVSNIIIRKVVLKKLKEVMKIKATEPLVHLIVGKRVVLPLDTGHSIPKIFNIMQATNALVDEGIYVLKDDNIAKYYIYHYPKDKDGKVYFFNTKNEPLAFNNISTKKDWVYKYILKMQEYGMELNGNGKGDFNKSAPRTQGEVLKIITKLFYKKNDLAGNGFSKYYNYLSKKKKGLGRLLPSNFSIKTLDSEVTRGDMANILVAFLSLEDKIKKADSNRARENVNESKGWHADSALLDVLNIAHGQNGDFGWDNNVTQAESLKFFVKTYEYYTKEN